MVGCVKALGEQIGLRCWLTAADFQTENGFPMDCGRPAGSVREPWGGRGHWTAGQRLERSPDRDRQTELAQGKEGRHQPGLPPWPRSLAQHPPGPLGRAALRLGPGTTWAARRGVVRAGGTGVGGLGSRPRLSPQSPRDLSQGSSGPWTSVCPSSKPLGLCHDV